MWANCSDLGLYGSSEMSNHYLASAEEKEVGEEEDEDHRGSCSVL